MPADAIDRIALACCRTNTGGDSYFQMKTMFLSPNLVMTPAKDLTAKEKSNAITQVACQPESAVVTSVNLYDVVFMIDGCPSDNKKDRLRIETIVTEIVDIRNL